MAVPGSSADAGAARAVATAIATAAGLAASPGLNGTVALVVSGGADGDVKVGVRLVDGRPVEKIADGGPPPDLTLTVPVAEAGAIADGTLDPSVAFMRGRLKTAGDNGLLLRLLAATAEPPFDAWLAGVVPPSPSPPPEPPG